MKMYLQPAAMSVAILASSSAVATEQQAFLSPQKAATILADGLPWSALDPDGTALKFMLLKDGTGNIQGPMPSALAVTWMIEGDAVCIAGKMGARCLRFREVPGGLQGWNGDKPDLKFTR